MGGRIARLVKKHGTAGLLNEMLATIVKDNYYYIPEKRLKTKTITDTLLSPKERTMAKPPGSHPSIG